MRKSSLTLILLLNILAFMEVYISVFGSQPLEEALEKHFMKYNAQGYAMELNYSRIKSHIERLSSLGSRVTGYPGSIEAAKYISGEFKKYGLKVILQNYTLPIPIDLGSWIEVNYPFSIRIKAFSLWPNGVQTCSSTKGLSGKLIYAGNGEVNEVNGRDVSGSIALIEFNSGMNWLKLANLGFKAFIFIEPDETSFFEALTKAVPVPINFPRLYVKRDDGLILKDIAAKNGTVTINSEMLWRNVEASNIIGVIEGVEHPNDVIVISARYDSWSIVPSLSPGAEDALSVSSLLEIARYFADPDHKPSRTLWFVAFSGHYQGLHGPYEWAEKILFSDAIQRGEKRILLHMDLDLSTETNAIDVLYTGPPSWIVSQAQALSRYYTFEQDIANFVSEFLKVDPEIIRFNSASMLWGTQPAVRDNDYIYRLNIQPTLQTGLLGFTLRTQYARRLRWFTPLNDYKYIDWNNFNTQIQMVKNIIAGFANKPSWSASYTPPTRFRFATEIANTVLGFVTLGGTTAEFSLTEGWYRPVPHVLVRMFYGSPVSYLLWPFTSRYTFSENNGTFVFHGLIPFVDHQFDAWVFSEDGSIAYTVDLGMYGAAAGAVGGIRLVVNPTSSETQVLLPIFNCVEVTVFDLIDVEMMREPQVSYTTANPVFQVYEIEKKSTPIFYNIYYAPSYGVGMAFVKRGTRVSLVFKPRREYGVSIILTNSTEDNPEGHGFLINEPLVIHRTAYQASKDMYHVCQGRYSTLSGRNVRNKSIEKLLTQVSSTIEDMERYFANHTYDKGYSSSLFVLSLVTKLYGGGVMPLLNEISFFMLFFSIPCIFFAFFFERLVFAYRGLARITSIALIMLFVLSLMSIICPAFSLMANSYLAILAIGLLLIGAFIIAIFVSESTEIMEEYAVRKMGMHLFKTEKVASMLHSIYT
ncbi:MAG: M28 family peptidase, partial [Candidatus Bathyarchaeia archaeon]